MCLSYIEEVIVSNRH